METYSLLSNRLSPFLSHRVQPIPETMNFFKQNKVIEISLMYIMAFSPGKHRMFRKGKVELYQSMKSI